MGKLLSVISSFASTTAAARCAFAALFFAARLGLRSHLLASIGLFFLLIGPGACRQLLPLPAQPWPCLTAPPPGP